ncbi:hypothetical protein G9P44_002618 [Scheffersomyces stipitis]|nr:hypothetical protein G9P44_002618 [Scheffersomyces stipitis]
MASRAGDSWFDKYSPKNVDEINIYPNISIYNRTLYTFGGKEEVYNKFLSYDAEILSQDELAFLDTNSCVLKIDISRYIVVVTVQGKVSVIGELNQRYIQKNKFDTYDLTIKDSKNYNIVPLTEIYNTDIFDYENLIERAELRVKEKFDEFMKQIRYGTTTFSD